MKKPGKMSKGDGKATMEKTSKSGKPGKPTGANKKMVKAKIPQVDAGHRYGEPTQKQKM